ncbi:MAG: hypothetical protein IJR28_03160, partial [Ottowia sp.]|nr:hypothetical protein [Ottowia sp.]
VTNYYTVSFFDGFFRRALIGTFLYPFGDARMHYHFIASVQLLAGVGLLVFVLYKALAVRREMAYILYLVCAFFLSRWGAFFFGMQGHPEWLMYLVALLSLSVKNSAVRVVLLASTVWMHEMAVFTCIPLWFALEYLWFERKKIAWVGLAVCAASFLVIYLFFQSASAETLLTYYRRLSVANYLPAFDYIEVFRSGLADEKFKAFGWYGQKDAFRLEGMYLELTLALGCILAAGIWAHGKNRFYAAIILGAALAPLLMGWFGYDVNRWVFLALANTITLFLVFLDRIGESVKAAFTAALLLCFLTCAPEMPDGKYYRTLSEAPGFVNNLGQHVASVPLR